MEKKEFCEKTVLITGGHTGIGRAISEAFAHAGADILILGKNQSTGEGAAKELASLYGVRAAFYKCDITCREEVDAVMEQIQKEWAKIDFLVNNAGIYPAAPFLEMEPELFEQIFRLNVGGVFHITQAVVNAFMKPQQKGKIISVSSIDSWKPTKGILAYAASKAALNSMVKSFAIELAEYHISSNGIAPGWVATEPVMKAGRWKSQIDSVLAGRMAQPSEIGELAVMLCTDRMDYMTGNIINFSGGLYMN